MTRRSGGTPRGRGPFDDLTSEELTTAAFIFDFDGTLAPIVRDPTAAVLVDGAEQALSRLAGHCSVLGILSGRPIAYLRSRFGEELWGRLIVAGSYGEEEVHRGVPSTTPPSIDVQAVSAAITPEVPPGVVLEVKPFSFTLHFRNAAAQEGAVRALAARIAEEYGFVRVDAKAAIEFFPVAEPSKGAVLTSWLHGSPRAFYFGDDRSDVAAFAALHELEGSGTRTTAVALAGPEVPPALMAAADVIVDSPADLVALLVQMLDRLVGA